MSTPYTMSAAVHKVKSIYSLYKPPRNALYRITAQVLLCFTQDQYRSKVEKNAALRLPP